MVRTSHYLIIAPIGQETATLDEPAILPRPMLLAEQMPRTRLMEILVITKPNVMRKVEQLLEWSGQVGLCFFGGCGPLAASDLDQTRLIFPSLHQALGPGYEQSYGILQPGFVTITRARFSTIRGG